MSFLESFDKFFRPRVTEEAITQADDLTDYDFLFSTFEKRRELAGHSVSELLTLSHNFKATFLETGIGKEYRQLIQEREDLQNQENSFGEIDMKPIHALNERIVVIENSKEFQSYKNLMSSIEALMSDEEGLKRVA